MRNNCTSQLLAAKIERADAKNPLLEYERRVYANLAHLDSIPRMHWYGRANNGQADFNVIVLDLLGDSLEKVLTKCNRRFTIKVTVMLAIQLVRQMPECRGFVRACVAF